MSYPMIVSIEGNFSAGKSTLLENVQSFIDQYSLKDVVIFKEPVHIWETLCDDIDGESILSKYYKYPKKYGFAFQMMAFQTVLLSLKKTIEENPQARFILCERSLASVRHVFTKMLYDDDMISNIEYKIFEMMYADESYSYLYEPSKVIYLSCSPRKCIERVLRRNRNGESNISLEYLEKIEKYNVKWLFDYHHPLKVIDVNNDVLYDMNNANNIGCRWVHMVMKSLYFPSLIDTNTYCPIPRNDPHPTWIKFPERAPDDVVPWYDDKDDDWQELE